MKLCKVTDLVGEEVVAKTVMTHDYQILLSEGTIIRKSYIRKLIEHQIDTIYIRGSELQETEEICLLKKDTENLYRDRIRELLEQHIYQQNEDIEEMSEIANIIITDILSDDKVLEQVYEIKDKSPDLYTHSIHVCALSTILALSLHTEATKVHDIALSALLHDMGWRFLPNILDGQTIRQITPECRKEYEKHTVYAYASLENATWLSEACKKMILRHHERSDGNGFPLKVTKLSQNQAILNICELFDEKIRGIGQPQISTAEAIEIVKGTSGVMFPEDVAEAMLKFIAVFPVGSKVVLSDKSTGIVLKQNAGFPERPIVQIIEKNGLIGPIRDLLRVKNITIIS